MTSTVLVLVLAGYGFTALVSFHVILMRFVRRPDVRGRSFVDVIDPSDSLIGFAVTFALFVFLFVFRNPVRFAHLVFKALFWPVTAALWSWNRSTEPPADIRDGRAPLHPRATG